MICFKDIWQKDFNRLTGAP